MNNTINLKIPQFHTTTRSFTQKVNVANYVKGHDYESVDFFASHNENIPIEEATPEKIKELSNRLYLLAKNEVEGCVDDYIRIVKEMVKDKVNFDILTAEEFKGIRDLMNDLNKVEDKDGVDKISEEIKDIKLDFNDRQLEYLRGEVKKAYGRTK